MAIHLSEKRCVACEGGTQPMTSEEAKILMAQLGPGWRLKENEIEREIKFKDFNEAMVFANQVAVIAEEEGHHPEIEISWGRIKIRLSTHAIGGLSENDFIVAAKIDKI